MLTSLEVFTAGVSAPPIPFVEQAASLDFIQIKKIDGLGPVAAVVNTTQYGSIDGEALDGTFTPKRNIVITAALNPDWGTYTYEDLRQILYSYFMTENQVRLRFTSTHLAPVEIIGIVETCEPDIFSRDPEFQISIVCPQPYFVGVNLTTVQGVTQAFAAPTDTIVTYEGNTDVGFMVDILLPSGGTAFTGEARVSNKTPSLQLAIVNSISVSTTQFFRYNSIQGSKSVKQIATPSGVQTSILGKLAGGSNWLRLHKGDNKIQVLTATAGLTYSLSYYAKYGGL